MKHLTPDLVTIALEPDLVAGPAVGASHFTGLSIDSRTVKSGEIFFAIVGDDNDGHKYVREAFRRGAAAAVINRSHLSQFTDVPGTVFAVDDTHEALLNLAAYIRRRTDAAFAAVTGSNGKTTTKEMFYAIACRRHATFRSPGNLNNLYGLPISLGMMPDDVDHAIFELGISVPGEMTRLTSVIKPELALITNIAPTHLETLKTIENVVAAKFELVDNLPVGAVIILNADDPLLTAEAARRGLDYVGFGITDECRFMARDITVDQTRGVTFTVEGHEISVPVFGQVNVYNALAAIAASSMWECGPEDWTAGLAAFRPIDLRMELEEYEGLHLIIDCYNANPASVSAGLQFLREVQTGGRRIAVLGDMLELGDGSADFHRRAGHEAARVGVDILFCLGHESIKIAEGAVAGGMNEGAVFHFMDREKLLHRLLEVIGRGDVILCKGSRGMELERIIIGLKGSAFKNN